MINGNAFIPNDGLNGTAAPWAAPVAGQSGPFPQGSPGYSGYGMSSGDGFRPAWFGGSNANDPLSSLGSTAQGGSASGSSISAILAQLSNQVQQTIARFSSALGGTSSSTTSQTSGNSSGGAASFQNVSLGSTGDPHLNVSGTEVNADGSTSSVNSKFDSMAGHQDLFSTRDFGDGFKVSTTVTQPSSNGITMNASATASMDGGRESVTMNNNGSISVEDHGQAVALAAGQTVTLSGGQNVSEAANGSVSISESRFGENLTTTFAQNGGGGVDVTAQGQNVTLGGDLITGSSTPVAQAGVSERQRYTTI